ncbi:GNAT family N-acetyltransferase [Paenibacillus albidus]|uniref:GNAT family N-acetyltransferase n=1 Tax=Paenibacillus albidus TaxID=2041023 RepID=UPI001BEA5018|nr:GNAT family N-acetyltransferase [Paenibacillus albidus]MBT2291080.1 GNAT family N-acetyltransferase [Paenibacillus albidus]
MDQQLSQKVENAILWARHHLNNTGYTLKCLGFVEDAYERSNGIEMFGGDTAAESAELYEAHKNRGIPPKGSFVFYSCSGLVEGVLRHWGHVGLALDHGEVIHAWDKVRIDSYLEIERLTPAPGWSRPVIIGWVPVEHLLAGSRVREWEQSFTIDCGDILLREYRMQDVDALVALTRQPEIAGFLPDWNVPKAQRAEWMMNYEIPGNRQFLQAADEEESIAGMSLRLGIISKESGEFIGWCCTRIKEELPEPNREVMYALSAKHRNKGYMTQAVLGLCIYLFGHTDVEELNAIALTRNPASSRVLVKAGFVFEQTLELENQSYHCYKLRKKG